MLGACNSILYIGMMKYKIYKIVQNSNTVVIIAWMDLKSTRCLNRSQIKRASGLNILKMTYTFEYTFLDNVH